MNKADSTKAVLNLLRRRCVKIQRQPVDAPTLAGRGGAILEQVSQMSATVGAVDLGSRVDQLPVRRCAGRFGKSAGETRPTGTAVELRRRIEQWVAATTAEVTPGAMLGKQQAGARRLGRRAAKHGITPRGECPAPFLVGSGGAAGTGFVGHGGEVGRMRIQSTRAGNSPLASRRRRGSHENGLSDRGRRKE